MPSHIHSPDSTTTFALAKQLGSLLTQRQWTISTAESCTGGGISAAITDIAGSSRWFNESFVTYSNHAKSETLGVPQSLLDSVGAVSEEVVSAMLKGLLNRTGATIGIAISGIAGPDGGSDEKPVGTVWIAWGGLAAQSSEVFVFKGNRQEVRAQAVRKALECACNWLRV